MNVSEFDTNIFSDHSNDKYLYDPVTAKMVDKLLMHFNAIHLYV